MKRFSEWFDERYDLRHGIHYSDAVKVTLDAVKEYMDENVAPAKSPGVSDLDSMRNLFLENKELKAELELKQYQLGLALSESSRLEKSLKEAAALLGKTNAEIERLRKLATDTANELDLTGMKLASSAKPRS